MISGTRFRLDAEIARQARLAAEIARGQTEIVTGKRILAPSDDPVGAARVAEIGRAQADEAVWTRNVETASALAARSDTVLANLALTVDRAKELMLRAANGTLSADNRATIAAELRGIATEIATLRDTRDARGEPLFRANGALEVPVGPRVRIAPVATRAAVFETPGDLLAVLNAAAAAVVEPDAPTRRAGIDASLAALDGANLQVASARADQGIRADRLDKIREALASSGLHMEEQRSSLESANIPEVIARIQSRDLNLKAAQAIFAQVNRTSLFDLIR
jgi:flagellar hook-associated protein 3 FlgL